MNAVGEQPRSRSHVLEIVLVALVLSAGVAIAIYGFATPPPEAAVTPAVARRAAEPEAPVATKTSSPKPARNSPRSDRVRLIDGRVFTDELGCDSVLLSFVWAVDPNGPAPRPPFATVDVRGPGLVGTYPGDVTETNVSVDLPVTVGPGRHTWTARATLAEQATPTGEKLTATFENTC